MQDKGLKDLLVKTAVSAGLEILSVYDLEKISVEYKDDDSPLTLADKKAHDCIVAALIDTGIPIISEEGELVDYEVRKKWNRFWLIDPLDGTKEFINRNGEFTVNIALIEEGRPTIGVIYVPVKGELYYGSPEDSFKLNAVFSLQDIPMARSTPLKAKSRGRQIEILVSRSHFSDISQKVIERIKKDKEVESISLVSMGSSLKMCMVAEGKADIYPRYTPTMEWDVAAGQAICQSVGLVVFDLETKENLQYNKPNLVNPFFVVSNDEKFFEKLV